MLRKWFRLLPLVAMLGLTARCQTGNGSSSSVDADQLSYRNQPLLEESEVPAASFAGADPGESELLARSFENAPPLIPHAVEDFLPITAGENACADCHLPDVAADSGATPVPASHLFDIRRGKELGGLAGANYSCTLCHAPQASAPTLIENSFDPAFRDAESATSSNLLEKLNEGIE